MQLRVVVKLLFSPAISVLAILLLSQAVYAQSTNLTDGTPVTSGLTQAESLNHAIPFFLDEIVTQARQQGHSVIVINAAATTHQDAPSSSDNPSAKRDGKLSLLVEFQTRFLYFRSLLKSRLRSLPVSIPATVDSLKRKSPTGNLSPYLGVLYWSILLLLLGAYIEHLTYKRYATKHWLSPNIAAEPKGYTEKLPLLIKRAIVGIGGVILSMIVAYLIGSTLFRGTPPEAIQFSIAIVYLTYAAVRVVTIIWQVILAPQLGQYRIPHFSDGDAQRLFYWLWITAAINIFAVTFSEWVSELGENDNVNAGLASTFGFLIALMNSALVLTNRSAISNAMRGGKPPNQAGTIMRLLSVVWVPFSIFYFLFSWLEMTYRLVLDEKLGVPLIAGAYGILTSIIVVYGVVNYLIEKMFQRKRTINQINAKLQLAENDLGGPVASSVASSVTSTDTDLEAEVATATHALYSFEDLARRVAAILALLVGFWALKTIWLVDQIVMDNEFSRRTYQIVAILFIGYIVYHIVRIWIDNRIREEGGDMPMLAPGDEGGASGASRLATLLPLFRNFMLTVVAISVLFSALLELGINVSPLFAGAGVVGLAIGFGAQTLVRDIFSGAFYLFDDAFRKGEYVDIGDVKGTVESISVRSFQLRHHLGPLHTIPFGEIRFLTNYSRDWVMMKLPLRLTYDTDPERVRKLIKKLGLSLMEDPEIGDTFLQPLKSQGVIEMQDSAMIVRVKFMTKPGDQWVIRKRVFQEIRDLFEREGIKFAHREVTVRLAGEPEKGLTTEQKHTVAAAALDDDLADSDSGESGDDR